MTIFKLITIMLAVLPTLLFAAEADPHAADRAQMLTILQEAEQGINQQNIDLFAKHIADDARVTWLNAEVSVGPQGVRDYYQKMVGAGKDAILSRYMTHHQVTDPARFYGDTVAVANGTMQDEFTPHARNPFKFDSRWTATLVKQGDVWKIASLNFSTNSFNNVLIDELKSKIISTALMASLTGLFLGVFIGARWARKRLNSK